MRLDTIVDILNYARFLVNKRDTQIESQIIESTTYILNTDIQSVIITREGTLSNKSYMSTWELNHFIFGCPRGPLVVDKTDCCSLCNTCIRGEAPSTLTSWTLYVLPCNVPCRSLCPSLRCVTWGYARYHPSYTCGFLNMFVQLGNEVRSVRAIYL